MYLEINSKNRNRKSNFGGLGLFEISLIPSGNNYSIKNYLDPVCESAPLLDINKSPDFIDPQLDAEPFLENIEIKVSLVANDNILYFTSQYDLSYTIDYYSKCKISKKNIVDGIEEFENIGVIENYIKLSKTLYKIYLKSSINILLKENDSLFINIAKKIIDNDLILFVHNLDSIKSSNIVYLYNENHREYLEIQNIDNESNIITCNIENNLNWGKNDYYTIRKIKSINLPENFFYNNYFYLINNDIRIGDFIRVNNKLVRIVSIKLRDEGPESEFRIFPAIDGNDNYNFEHHPYSYDNVSNISGNSILNQYRGRLVQISLSYIILPNVLLNNYKKTSDYNIVYLSIFSHNRELSILHNNNDLKNQIDFSATIDKNRSDDKYCTFTSEHNMIRKIIYERNDFLIKIFLSDGDIFNPLELDNISPLPPKEHLQTKILLNFYD